GVSEIFRIYFSFSSIIYDIPATIIRGIVTFFLTIEIINFHWSYNYDVDPNKNDIVFNIALPKYELTKLFIFAILIMGVSIAYIIRVSHIEPTSNLAYEYFALILISDIARMLILIFIVPRFLIKGNIIKIKETAQYDTAIEESNSGKDLYNNNEQQEKQQQQQQERQQTCLQQQLPQRYDYSYIYNSEEMSRVKQADDDAGNNNNDYNKNKIRDKQTFDSVNILNELKDLADLRKNEIITEEEFQMLKTRLFRKI
ncbi:MAG: SHOCT domain-containing protein, partial [Nitrososphaeraceae archaeon]|nr:SHOCT domain-containing protein [Nitrososphaeraceae archaeon]